MGERFAETRLTVARVNPEALDRMVGDYRRRPTPVWLIDAAAVTSFSAESVGHAVNLFAELNRRLGLVAIVPVITTPLVRMGAATVAMSLRAMRSPVEIHVVDTREEAVRKAGELAEARPG